MQIRTIATFYDEEKKQEIEGGFIFDLFEVSDANEIQNGYTCITISSTGLRTNIKIKFDTFWELIKEKHLNCKKIVE